MSPNLTAVESGWGEDALELTDARRARAVLGHECQVQRGGHRTVGAQQRVHEFEQFAPAR
ncbi:hypothetical protein RKD29_007541 [Streptomyces tendae]